MWLHGFGFPRYRGGLMFWADTVGSKAILDQINDWHERYGERWKPSDLLREIGSSGGSLREAKGAGM
jgi:3-hydroxyacyl-CoA dehydrogenase